jgi:hypothetical protein
MGLCFNVKNFLNKNIEFILIFTVKKALVFDYRCPSLAQVLQSVLLGFNCIFKYFNLNFSWPVSLDHDLAEYVHGFLILKYLNTQ